MCQSPQKLDHHRSPENPSSHACRARGCVTSRSLDADRSGRMPVCRRTSESQRSASLSPSVSTVRRTNANGNDARTRCEARIRFPRHGRMVSATAWSGVSATYRTLDTSRGRSNRPLPVGGGTWDGENRSRSRASGSQGKTRHSSTRPGSGVDTRFLRFESADNVRHLPASDQEHRRATREVCVTSAEPSLHHRRLQPPSKHLHNQRQPSQPVSVVVVGNLTPPPAGDLRGRYVQGRRYRSIGPESLAAYFQMPTEDRALNRRGFVGKASGAGRGSHAINIPATSYVAQHCSLRCYPITSR